MMIVFTFMNRDSRHETVYIRNKDVISVMPFVCFLTSYSFMCHFFFVQNVIGTEICDKRSVSCQPVQSDTGLGLWIFAMECIPCYPPQFYINKSSCCSNCRVFNFGIAIVRPFDKFQFSLPFNF